MQRCSSIAWRATRSCATTRWTTSSAAGGACSRRSASRFDHPEALRSSARRGRSCEDEVVRLDPDFVLEQVAKAPCDVHAARPQPRAQLRGRRRPHGLRRASQGPPFVREGDVRRDGDVRRLLPLPQARRRSTTTSTRRAASPCEPNDLPLDSRHLDMQLALLTLTDKPYSGAQVSPARSARDALAMAAIGVRRRRGADARDRRSTRSSTSTRRCSTTSACSTRCSRTRAPGSR